MDITQQLKKIEEELYSIKNRLFSVEEQLKNSTPPKGESNSPLKDKVYNYEYPFDEIKPEISREKQFEAQPKTEQQTGNWLAGISILFFILAASYFVRLALDSGWLTPTRQLAGLLIFSLGLIFAGYSLKKRDLAYASFLPACGSVIMFLTVYSGHLYYKVYDLQIALFLIAATSVFSLFLFDEFKHSLFLISAICGTYFFPALVSNDEFFSVNIKAYFIAWDVLFCIAAILLRNRLMIGLASYLALIFYLTLAERSSPTKLYLDIAFFEFLQFMIFSYSIAYFSYKLKISLNANQAWSLFPMLLIFYVIEYSLLSAIYPDVTPYIALAFALFCLTFYSFVKSMMNLEKLESAAALHTFVAIIFFHAFYIELIPSSLAPFFVIGLVFISTYIKKESASDLEYWILRTLIIAIAFCEYLSVLFNYRGLSIEQNIFHSLLFSLSILFYHKASEASSSPIILSLLGHLQALNAFKNIAANIASYPNNKIITSSFWAIYAFGVLFYSYLKKDTALARTCIIIFGIVAVKVIFEDLVTSGSHLSILALLVIGVLFYIGGLVWKQINSWK